MSLPDFDKNGYLPPGIHAASLAEVLNRLGTASQARSKQAELLCQVVEADTTDFMDERGLIIVRVRLLGQWYHLCQT
jgi:hypothetical protein